MSTLSTALGQSLSRRHLMKSLTTFVPLEHFFLQFSSVLELALLHRIRLVLLVLLSPAEISQLDRSLIQLPAIPLVLEEEPDSIEHAQDAAHKEEDRHLHSPSL